MPDIPIEQELERVSQSFCPLRWSYMQADMSQGKVKACCKTPFVQIASQWIQRDGTGAIFNNPEFQARREGMLRGEKHADCRDCWQNEAAGILSYRYHQSALPLFRRRISSIASERSVGNAFPAQLELIASTTCNLKCCYCGPEFSSSWAAELRSKGPYPGDTGWVEQPAAPEFGDTFWAWLETALPHLSYLQFNGGEPLLQDEVYKMLERILALVPNGQRLQIGVISNLNLPEGRMERFCQVLPALLDKHDFRLGVSQDSVGKRAEYIRNGLCWERFDANLSLLLAKFPALEIQLAPTMSALNVTSIQDLLRYSAELVRAHGPRLIMRPSIVNWPAFQTPSLLPKEFGRHLDEAIAYLHENSLWPNMANWLRDIELAIVARPDDEERDALRKTFFRWFSEFDRRRKLSFVDTFPEIEGFWRDCASL